MLKVKGNKGITLIALIITIIVLLILAGVTINAISGNESAMDKAKEAKEKNEQGAELDAIKMAVVNSVASDLTGLVNAENLKEGLNGIVEDEGRLKINQDNAPWIVTGKTGMKYKINQNGEVTSAEPVASVEFVNTTDSIAVGKSKKLEIVAKGASGNITEANEITFSSSNTSIAAVQEDGDIKIADNATIGATATITVVADGIEGNNECIITVISLPKVGDYVDYQAGEWSQEEIDVLTSNGVYAGEIPAKSNFKFSGFKVGDNKDVGVTVDTFTSGKQGWRIFKINDDGTMDIIHAGVTEAYYHYYNYNGFTGAKSQYILGGGKMEGIADNVYSGLYARDFNEYAKGKNAVQNSGRLVNPNELYSLPANSPIRNINFQFWFPVGNDHGSLRFCNWGNYNWAEGDYLIGIRPMVTLKSNINWKSNATSHTTYDNRWFMEE